MKKKIHAGAAMLALGVFGATATGVGAMPFDTNIASLGRSATARHTITRVAAVEPVLAPMAHLVFCNSHKEQCESGAPELLKNDEKTFNALVSVNQQVNKRIEPMQRSLENAIGNWQINPAVGDCNDAPAPAAAASAAPETTGSIKTNAPQTNRLPIVEGWSLRDVYDGTATVVGRQGIFDVIPGDPLPGVGRVDAIRRQDGRWVVVTSRGLIIAR